MMKLALSLALIGMLSGTAGALTCKACQDVACSSSFVQTCTTETSCISAAFQATGFGGSLQESFQLCAPNGTCPATGNFTYSASTSGFSASAATTCCNTTNCNSALPGVVPTQSVNALRCYSCDATNSNCSIQIQCKGVENRCFKANVTIGSLTSNTLGCASANLCALAISSSSSIPVLNGIANISCCDTNLCNTAPMTTSTTIGLLLGLVVFSLF